MDFCGAAHGRIGIETAFSQNFIIALRVGSVKKYIGNFSGYQQRSDSDARVFVRYSFGGGIEIKVAAARRVAVAAPAAIIVVQVEIRFSDDGIGAAVNV